MRSLKLCRKLASLTVLLRSLSTKSVQYEGVVGLEIHAQISSESKLFSGAAARFGALVNNCVSEFDAAVPGTLPRLNKKCVEAALRTSMALNCSISEVTTFDRKHYFYADMPAGYQITQQRSPIARNGFLQFPLIVQNRIESIRSELVQIQLEQDSGKSLHDEAAKISLVDLNRAGMPLMEFVFAPDLKNGSEAAALVKELSLILTQLGVSSCKMEEGALRVDANVSVRAKNASLGTRTEVKNIGSVRGVAHAVDFEIRRQIGTLQAGGVIVNETRSWDAESKRTLKMRDKEVVQDYRFMPEPNLLPLRTARSFNLSEISKSVPELPRETRQRLEETHKLKKKTVIDLVEDPPLLQLFEEVIDGGKASPQRVANVLINDLRALYNQHEVATEDGPIGADRLRELVQKLEDGTINHNLVQPILEAAFREKKSVDAIIRENEWQQIVDEDQITQTCVRIMSENPKLVKQFREKGKDKYLAALHGLVARADNGRINMAKATEILKRLLES